MKLLKLNLPKQDTKSIYYVADNIQKIQMIFLSNCADTSSINSNFQQMYTWLDQTNEVESLMERAESRKKIISAIAKENDKEIGK